VRDPRSQLLCAWATRERSTASPRAAWRVYVGGAANTVVRPDVCGTYARPAAASAVWFDLVIVQGE
jgi:hypothetical protein